MITVHHLNNSRSQRILWLLEELGLPYDIRYYERNPETMRAPAELRAVHPLGRSPIITDGEIVVAETGAVIEYLLDTYAGGQLRPADGSADRRRFTYWLHFAEGSEMSPLLMRLVFDRLVTAPMPFFAKPIARGITKKVRDAFVDPQIAAHLDFIDSELQRSEWFAGADFSAADIQMSFPLEVSAQRAGLGAGHQKIKAFLGRIHSRPAYHRALERGGPYAFAK